MGSIRVRSRKLKAQRYNTGRRTLGGKNPLVCCMGKCVGKKKKKKTRDAVGDQKGRKKGASDDAKKKGPPRQKNSVLVT